MLSELVCLLTCHDWRAGACAPSPMEKATLVERECSRCGVWAEPEFFSNAYAVELGCPVEVATTEDAGKWVRDE